MPELRNIGPFSWDNLLSEQRISALRREIGDASKKAIAVGSRSKGLFQVDVQGVFAGAVSNMRTRLRDARRDAREHVADAQRLLYSVSSEKLTVQQVSLQRAHLKDSALSAQTAHQLQERLRAIFGHLVIGEGSQHVLQLALEDFNERIEISRLQIRKVVDKVREQVPMNKIFIPELDKTTIQIADCSDEIEDMLAVLNTNEVVELQALTARLPRLEEKVKDIERQTYYSLRRFR